MQKYAAPKLKEVLGPPRPIFCEYETRLTNCEIAENCYFGFGTYLNKSFVRSSVRIGRYCSIGRNVTIGSGSHDIKNITCSPYFKLENSSMKLVSVNPVLRTIVGNDCWIGDYAYIMSGIKIGHGAVIGANSVVTHDVEPYTIVVGSPARKIKYRFQNFIIEELLRTCWWEKSPLELRALFESHKTIDEIIKILPTLNFFPVNYIKCRTHQSI